MNTHHHTPAWLSAVYSADDLSVLNRPHPIFGLRASHATAASAYRTSVDRRRVDWWTLARTICRRVITLFPSPSHSRSSL
jgi:hypothetical protein